MRSAIGECPSAPPQRRAHRTPLVTHLILLLFISLQIGSLDFHEPWADELQAWLLARDSSLWELLSTRLRYEVTPGLWHVILWIVARFTHDVAALNALSVLVACVSCALILYVSPFPWIVRALLPFTYYLAYQYAVVARNYCLTTLFTILAAISFQRRLERPWPYVVSLLLLAHTSSHGFLMAAGLALADLWPLEGGKKKASLFKCTPVFVLGMLASLIQFWPVASDYWFKPSRGGGSVLSTNLQLWNAVDESFLAIPPLSLVVGGLSLWVFQRCGVLKFYLVPFTLVSLLFIKHWAYWHTGLLFLIWLFSLYQCYARPNPVTQEPWWVAALGLMLLVQVKQTALTVERDIAEPYFGLKQAAEDIKSRGIDLDEIELRGYYPSTLWAFFPPVPGSPKYYRWCRKSVPGPPENKPYVLAVAGQTEPMSRYRIPRLKDYRILQFYQGTRPWKGRFLFQNNSFVLLERTTNTLAK